MRPLHTYYVELELHLCQQHRLMQRTRVHLAKCPEQSRLYAAGLGHLCHHDNTRAHQAYLNVARIILTPAWNEPRTEPLILDWPAWRVRHFTGSS